MTRVSLTRLAAGIGGLALAATAAAGIASAQPYVDTMVNSPCTYDQAIAAVNAENPMAAQYLMQSPPNLQFVRVLELRQGDPPVVAQPDQGQSGDRSGTSGVHADDVQLRQLLTTRTSAATLTESGRVFRRAQNRCIRKPLGSAPYFGPVAKKSRMAEFTASGRSRNPRWPVSAISR